MSDAPKGNAFGSGEASRLSLDLDELERQLRQLSAKPATNAAPLDDPMAELARLVGRDDPIRTLLTTEAPAASASVSATPAPASWQPAAPHLYQETPAEPEGYRSHHDFGRMMDDDAAASLQPTAQSISPREWRPAETTAPAGEMPVARQADMDDYGESRFEPVAAGRASGAQPAMQRDADGLFPPDYVTSPADYPPGYHVPAGDDADLVPLDNKRSRRGLLTVGVLMATAIVGVAGALSLRDRGPQAPSGAPPVITADTGPAKVAPQNPGGVDIPNQNKQIYDRGAPAVPEATKVVNREEQPVDVRQTARALAQRDSINGLIGATAAVPPAPSQAEGASNGLSALGEPKRVRTVAVRPDGTIVSDQTPSASQPLRPPTMQLPATAGGTPVRTAAAAPVVVPVPAPAATPPVAATTPAPVAPPPQPPRPTAAAPVATTTSTTTQAAVPPRPAVPAPSPVAQAPAAPAGPAAGAPLSITPTAGQAKLQQRVASAPVPAPEAPRAAAPAPVASSGGDFMVQLAARPSEREALDAFSQLQRRYTDLAGYSPVVRRAEVGDKTIYRLRVGSMSREDANALCSKLQASGGQCFVARN